MQNTTHTPKRAFARSASVFALIAALAFVPNAASAETTAPEPDLTDIELPADNVDLLQLGPVSTTSENATHITEPEALELEAMAAQTVMPVYRFWSEKYKAHFYTADLAERNRVIATWPKEWSYEKVAYGAYGSQVDGTVPVYRFWSEWRKSHFYTTDPAEKAYVEKTWPDVWKYEKVAFYTFPETSTASGLQKITRFWSAQFHSHFYTADSNEVTKVVQTWPKEWSLEGERFKALPAPAGAPLPAPQLNQRDQWKQDAGIARSDWTYVDYIVQRESGWNPNAMNPSSGTCGLVQIAPVHGAAYTTCKDPVANLRWANSYAKNRYGSWAQAYNFWINNHWW